MVIVSIFVKSIHNCSNPSLDVFGWEGDVLQKAMDANCFGATCKALKSQSFADANKCAIQKTVKEDVDGWLTEIPSGMPMKEKRFEA